MAYWGFWEWLAYGTTFIAAVLLAIIQGVKDMTSIPSWVPSFLMSRKWNYAPLALMVIGAFIFCAKEIGWVGNHSANGDAFVFNPKQKLETIYQRQYKNETVYLDGKKFVDCTFDNVTFIYKGTAPVELYDAHFTLAGGVRLTSPNPAINEVLTLMNNLSQIKPIGEGSTISPEQMNELLNKPQ